MVSIHLPKKTSSVQFSEGFRPVPRWAFVGSSITTLDSALGFIPFIFADKRIF